MATVTTKLMTAEEFFEFVHRPENRDRFFELVAGKVIEMPPPGERHGILCGWIGHLLWGYVIKRGMGSVCTNDTGLIVEQGPDTVRGPDIMLLGESRSLESANVKYVDRIPRLVVEALSPTDKQTESERRLSQYQKRGVPLVWFVYPDVRSITVYQRGKDVVVLDETDTITGDEILPELQFRVSEFFTIPGTAP